MIKTGNIKTEKIKQKDYKTEKIIQKRKTFLRGSLSVGGLLSAAVKDLRKNGKLCGKREKPM